MGYLICQDCKGYYKLKSGENPEDFTDTCACGGKLKYALDIEFVGTATSRDYSSSSSQKNNTKFNQSKHDNSQFSASNSTNTTQSKSNLFNCPDCGHKISKKAKSCPNCGRELTYEDIHGHEFRLTIESVIGIIIVSFFVCSIIAYIGNILHIYAISGGAVLAFLFILIVLPISYFIDRKKLKQSKITNV